jgi:hypothetical protein
MKTFQVAAIEDLRKMADILEKQGRTIIYRDSESFSAFEGGRLVKIVEVGRRKQGTQ